MSDKIQGERVTIPQFEIVSNPTTRAPPVWIHKGDGFEISNTRFLSVIRIKTSKHDVSIYDEQIVFYFSNEKIILDMAIDLSSIFKIEKSPLKRDWKVSGGNEDEINEFLDKILSFKLFA